MRQLDAAISNEAESSSGAQRDRRERVKRMGLTKLYQVFYIDCDGNQDSIRLRAISESDAERKVLAADPEAYNFQFKQLDY